MKNGMNLGAILDQLDGAEHRPRPPDARPGKKRRGRPRVKKYKELRPRPGALTDADVLLVRQLYAYRLTYQEIVDKFDDRDRPPSLSAIKHICRGLRRARVK